MQQMKHSLPEEHSLATAGQGRGWRPSLRGVLIGGALLVGAGVGGLLAYENSIVKPDDLSRINVAFFNINSYIAITLFVGTFLALII